MFQYITASSQVVKVPANIKGSVCITTGEDLFLSEGT
jgi:hypothetical protein